MSIYRILEDAVLAEMEQNSALPEILHLEPEIFNSLSKELVIDGTTKKLPADAKRVSIKILDHKIEVRSEDYVPKETIH